MRARLLLAAASIVLCVSCTREQPAPVGPEQKQASPENKAKPEDDGFMELTLPATGDARLPKEPEREPTVRIVVRADKDGEPRKIAIIEVQTGKKIEFDAAPNWKKKLLAELKKLKPTSKDSVALSMSSSVRWTQVVDFMDICKDAGLRNVGFQPPPDFDKGIPDVPEEGTLKRQ